MKYLWIADLKLANKIITKNLNIFSHVEMEENRYQFIRGRRMHPYRKEWYLQRSIAIILVHVILMPFLAAGSSGDRRSDYKICAQNCIRSYGCNADGIGNITDNKSGQTEMACSSICLKSNISPYLKIMQWDCESDCGYWCMWKVENSKRTKSRQNPNIKHGSVLLKTEKYHGKWPFARVFGVQEPASVVFSVLNLVVNWLCLRNVIKMTSLGDWSEGKNPMTSNFFKMLKPPFIKTKNSLSRVQGPRSSESRTKYHYYSVFYCKLWALHFLLACNAWLWSTVFHCRDTRRTEKWDYFSAGALILFNLYVSLVRSVEIKRKDVLIVLGGVLLSGYAWHLHQMVMVHFDYGRHVMLCIVMGGIQTGIWLTWALISCKGKKHPGKPFLFIFMASINVAMLLEILDFPPIFDILDAHALWHAATIPLIFVWYRFVRADILLFQKQANI